MSPDGLAPLLQQVHDLLQQLARLVPLTEKLAAASETTEAALADIGQGVPRAFRQIIAADTGLHTRIKDLESKIEAATTEAKGARIMAELAVNHASEVEKQVRSLSVWLKLGLTLMIVLLLVAIALLVGR